MKRLLVLGLLLTALSSLSGCSTTSAPRRWVRSEVYFGLSKPDGTRISPEQWQGFVDQVVTPRFPAGLSIVDTSGQWRNAQGKIEQEPSKMIVLIHPPSARTNENIDQIRRAYCQQFSQEAVMKVTGPVAVAF